MNLKAKLVAALLLLGGALPHEAGAQNPFVQSCYTPDPAPMVHDGTLYVYTGHDEDKADFFWMQEWRVYSTKDMVNWTDHGSPLAIESFDWADDRAWAAQCIERNGKFYWYVCLHSKLSNTMAIGVAVGDSPVGPFKDAIGKPLHDGSWDYIDPTVFIDDDGRAYLYWGNPNIYYAELNEDMISLKGGVGKLEQTVESFKSGVELTLKQLTSAFEKNALFEVNPAGEKLDPHKHQAISVVDSEQDANTVVTVLQKGYTIADRLLRPALVIVAKQKS